MDEKDMRIQQLLKEAAKWKSRVLEVAEKACFECEEYQSPRDCEKCRVMKIKREASEGPRA